MRRANSKSFGAHSMSSKDTRKKDTKRALVSSMVALVLCCAMLVGTTFAWFTDSVTSGKNKIVAGNLQIDLVHVAGGENGADVSIKENPDHLIFDYDKWEPGYTAVETLRVENKGNLALKFRLDMFNAGATSGANNEKLADVIDVYVYEGDGSSAAISFADMTEANGWRNAGSLSSLMADSDGMAYGILLPVGAEPKNDEPVGSIQMTVALHMQESAGNAYQGLSLGELSFVLNATQYTFEEDGFDKQYDSEAGYPVDSSSFVNMLEKGGLLSLTEDVTVATTYKNPTVITMPDNAVLDMGGKTISSENMGLIIQGENITIQNGKFSGLNNASYGLFIGDSGITNNVVIQNITMNGGINVFNASKVILRNCEIHGTKYYAVWADNNAEIIIESGTYYAGNVGKAIYSSDPKNPEVDGPAGKIIVRGGSFDTDPSAYVDTDAYKVEHVGDMYIVTEK